MADDVAGDPLDRARALLADRRYADAETEARSVLRSDPYSASASALLAESLIAQGKTEAARSAAERAVATEPNRPEGHIALAGAWLAVNRPDQAEPEARLALQLAPASADAHMVLASALLAAEKAKEAEREFDLVIALEPSDLASDNLWKRWRAPVVVAVSVAAFIALHSLGLITPRFTDWRVAVLLLALAFVLVVAVLIGLAMQRRALARLSPAERVKLQVETRRRRARGRTQLAFEVLVLAVVIGGLSLVTLLFAVGQKASLQVAIGDCFSVDRRVSIEEYSAIPCVLPHDFEVFAVMKESSPPGVPFPGSEVLHTRLRAECERLYEGYVGVPFGSEAPTGIHTFAPEESYWRLDIRTEFCALHDWDEKRQLIGSRRAST